MFLWFCGSNMKLRKHTLMNFVHKKTLFSNHFIVGAKSSIWQTQNITPDIWTESYEAANCKIDYNSDQKMIWFAVHYH